MPRVLGLLASLGLAAAVALPPATVQASPARVPQGFVGVMADGPVFDPTVDLASQFDTMVASGVESVRVVFDWNTAQPYPSWSDVPSSQTDAFTQTQSGVPTDFGPTDQIVTLAAQRGLSVLPVVMNSPYWDAVSTGTKDQPQDDGPYADYLTALVQRYGPNGTFWSDNPDLTPDPIRQWQIWNEPDLTYWWSSQPWQPSYVALLKAAHDAIKAADPGAKVVLAGLPNKSWLELGSLYKIRGARSLFDVVAVHAYTARPAGVITILGNVRTVMDRYGDRTKPILATEMGWPSSLGQTNQRSFDVATTQAGQATKLGQVLPLLAGARTRLGLAGFDLYTWMGDEYPGADTFDFSGLFGFNPNDDSVFVKPAYATFRHAALAMEACAVKGPVATQCSTAAKVSPHKSPRSRARSGAHRRAGRSRGKK